MVSIVKFSAPLLGSLESSTLWYQWIQYNIKNFIQFSEVFPDYFHPILQRLIFLIASDFSFHKQVLSRGMVIPTVVLVLHVVKHVVLRVHILALNVEPFLFHSPTFMLSQCTTSIPSLWLPCILFLVLFSDLRRAISRIFNAKIINHQGKVYWLTVVFPWSGFLA